MKTFTIITNEAVAKKAKRIKDKRNLISQWEEQLKGKSIYTKEGYFKVSVSKKLTLWEKELLNEKFNYVGYRYGKEPKTQEEKDLQQAKRTLRAENKSVDFSIKMKHNGYVYDFKTAISDLKSLATQGYCKEHYTNKVMTYLNKFMGERKAKATFDRMVRDLHNKDIKQDIKQKQKQIEKMFNDIKTLEGKLS